MRKRDTFKKFSREKVSTLTRSRKYLPDWRAGEYIYIERIEILFYLERVATTSLNYSVRYFFFSRNDCYWKSGFTFLIYGYLVRS